MGRTSWVGPKTALLALSRHDMTHTIAVPWPTRPEHPCRTWVRTPTWWPGAAEEEAAWLVAAEENVEWRRRRVW